MHSRYLSPEDLERLANYRFAVNMTVEGWLSGKHHARGRGASSDFLEYRPYAPGDDPRLVDWRVFARTDRLHVKTFQHETHLDCHLFVDCSGSMGYRGGGPVSKLEYACFFAACVAWLVVRGNDRVSLHLFDEGIRASLPPGSTRRHLDQLLSLLEHHRAGGSTGMSTALQNASPLLTKAGTLIVVSDFLDEPSRILQSLHPYLHRGFNIILTQVLDPWEIELPRDGLVRYRDVETGERLVFSSETGHRDYRERAVEHRAALRSMCLSRGIRFFSAGTAESCFLLLDALSR